MINPGQNWNNLLNYIKRNLGSKYNLLELSDDEIIEGIKEDVIPFFSQYSPDKIHVSLSERNRVTHIDGQPLWKYEIKTPNNLQIIDIPEVYYTKEESIATDLLGITVMNSENAIDLVIANSFIDGVKSLQVRNTWEFQPPNFIIFDQEVSYAIIVCNVPHQDLKTISPDIYQSIFKPYALAHVKGWLSALRSKYESIQLPMGQINLNWQKLEDEANRDKEKYEQLMNMLPPDFLVHVSV